KIWLVITEHEGFCLPILEAMACGCAVISSNHVNAPELIQDGLNGFIIPFGDINAYLKRIKLLLADESLRRRMVEEGFKTVNRFNSKEASDKMEAPLLRLNAPANGAFAGQDQHIIPASTTV